jgi:sulfate permease, SulP family
MTVVVALSLASLIFSGPLAMFLPLGSMLFLGATAAVNMVSARTTSLPGSVLIPQDATTAIAATALGAVLVGLPSDVALTTALVILGLGTGITAVAMLLLGGFRLGSLMRFLPYPVMGGFLAATGVLLLVGASDLITGGFAWSNATIIGLTAGGALGVILLIVAIRGAHPLVLPGIILGAVVIFYGVISAFGLSIAEARDLGLLASSLPAFGLPEVSLGPVNWSAVSSAAPALVTIPIVAIVSLLLNVGGLELVARADLDLDDELRSAGWSNIAGALLAVPAAYHALSLTALGFRAGVISRYLPLVVVAMCVVAAVAGPALVAFLPVPVVGAMLAMLGLSFVFDWVVEGRKRMTSIEYLLMLVILLALVVLGFLIGVAFGMASAMLLFAVTYSRLDPIRHSFTAADRASSVERSSATREALRDLGKLAWIVEVQGYLFFGTAHSVANRIRSLLRAEDVRALVIDLRRVEGLDSTATLTFAKLNRELADRGVRVVISHANNQVFEALVRAGVSPDEVKYVSDLDHGLEFCEELLLEDVPDEESNPWMLPDRFWQRLVPHLDRLEVGAGSMIADRGEHDSCVFIVESGRIAAEIPVAERRWQRVRSAGPGGVLGEMSMYGDGTRTARLVAESDCVVLRLSAESIVELEGSDPECAIAFHRAFARVISTRLIASNDLIRALIR